MTFLNSPTLNVKSERQKNNSHIVQKTQITKVHSFFFQNNFCWLFWCCDELDKLFPLILNGSWFQTLEIFGWQLLITNDCFDASFLSNSRNYLFSKQLLLLLIPTYLITKKNDTFEDNNMRLTKKVMHYTRPKMITINRRTVKKA